MPFFKKIFQGKPLKRIELKAGTPKFRIRASRTGGINAAVHPLRGLTFNTKHGLRVSKTFMGLTLGIQRGNAVVRGRWSSKDGLLNLNLSKSGFSISSKSKFGNYNFTHPHRSSFKFGGIQLRGKKASGLAGIATLFTLLPYLIIIPFQLISFLAYLIMGLAYLIMGLIQLFFSLILALLKLAILLSEVLMFIIVDFPRQLINLFFRKEIFDVSPDAIDLMEYKIIENEISFDDLKVMRKKRKEIEYQGLKTIVDSYQIPYSEISKAKKLLSIILLIFGVSFYFTALSLLLATLSNLESIDDNMLLLIVAMILFSSIFGIFFTKPFNYLRLQKKNEDRLQVLSSEIK